MDMDIAGCCLSVQNKEIAEKVNANINEILLFVINVEIK